MALATQPYHNRLAVVFDFDDTLAPDSYTELLNHFGKERDAFNAERIQPREDEGWDHVLARFYALIEATQDGEIRVTRDLLEKLGRETELFDGVADLFDRVRETAQSVLPEIEVAFYMITGGSEETARSIPIADEFEHIWGCAFHFNDDGEVAFLKRLITHPEKTRYLLELSKNPDWNFVTEPENVHRDVDPHDLHIPLDQVIYVGDGASDMPAFRLMNEHDGMAIGVVLSETMDAWRGHDDMAHGRRVQNLAPADYSPDSELMRSLLLSVESITKRVALRKLSAGK